MTGIIVALPRMDDARNIKNLLVRNGYPVTAVCTSGAQALAQTDSLNDGIIICGYKLTDMLYSQLYESLPPGFEMLLMASQRFLMECLDNDIVCLAMPFQLNDFINTVEMMSTSIVYKRKERRKKPKERKPEETALINEAKLLLMNRNNMTEEEAHRYLQKTSMDNATGMVETAQMVLRLMMD